MANGNVKSLADKIAGILETESRLFGFSTLQASLDKINERLDKLESISEKTGPVSGEFSGPHPSSERFSVIDAIADEITLNLNKEKACTFEPTGKPCDHCSMCSSRGF